MKRKLFLSWLITVLVAFLFFTDQVSYGKGGHYTGGTGKGGRSGSHYYNPATGNHYNKSNFSPRSSGSGFRNTSVQGGNSYKPSVNYAPISRYDGSVARDQNGRIVRSEGAKEAFLRSRGLNHVPAGYEVDHVVPLYGGGSDTPSNMQLLTIADHKEKTKTDYQRFGR
jgi:hypothetical protein